MDKSLFFEIIGVFENSPKINFLRLETDGMKIELGTERRRSYQKSERHDALYPSGQADIPAEFSDTPEAGAAYEVKSPIVGTFYERSSPDAEPYVKVGQHVKKGDVLCIVEAMKMMNEIECETSGVVSEILVKSGDMIEFDQIIMKIEKL